MEPLKAKPPYPDFAPCACGAGSDLGGHGEEPDLCLDCALRRWVREYGSPPTDLTMDEVEAIIELRDDPLSLSYASWHRN